MSIGARLDRLERLAPGLGESVLPANPIALAESLGMQPDPWQCDVLLSRAPRIVLLCARQTGKSTVSGLLAVDLVLREPGSLVLLVSPSLRQSGELARKVTGFLEALGERVGLVEDNKLSLMLPNRSRVVCLPSSEATIRGFSAPDLIVEDEAARVADELHSALTPMLATNEHGRLLLMSTPWGRRGHFFEAWENGGPDWERVKVTAEECPRISPEFLARERRGMDAFHYRQEYLVEFLDSEDSVFRTEDIQAALSPTVAPLLAGWP